MAAAVELGETPGSRAALAGQETGLCRPPKPQGWRGLRGEALCRLQAGSRALPRGPQWPSTHSAAVLPPLLGHLSAAPHPQHSPQPTGGFASPSLPPALALGHNPPFTLDHFLCLLPTSPKFPFSGQRHRAWGRTLHNPNRVPRFISSVPLLQMGEGVWGPVSLCLNPLRSHPLPLAPSPGRTCLSSTAQPWG